MNLLFKAGRHDSRPGLLSELCELLGSSELVVALLLFLFALFARWRSAFCWVSWVKKPRDYSFWVFAPSDLPNLGALRLQSLQAIGPDAGWYESFWRRVLDVKVVQTEGMPWNMDIMNKTFYCWILNFWGLIFPKVLKGFRWGLVGISLISSGILRSYHQTLPNSVTPLMLMLMLWLVSINLTKSSLGPTVASTARFLDVFGIFWSSHTRVLL